MKDSKNTLVAKRNATIISVTDKKQDGTLLTNNNGTPVKRVRIRVTLASGKQAIWTTFPSDKYRLYNSLAVNQEFQIGVTQESWDIYRAKCAKAKTPDQRPPHPTANLLWEIAPEITDLNDI